MSDTGLPVDLYVYDLTLGFASLLAPAIIGRAVEGVWHTGVVAYGREFFFGGQGITSCAPGTTQLGQPQRVERLGETFVPYQVFADYLHGLSTTTYTAASYSLLEHNCNHFSDEVAGFLCGARVPKHILRQPEELLSAPQRDALALLLTQLAPEHGQTVYGADGGAAPGARRRDDSPEYDALNSQIEEARVQSRSLEAQRSTLADKLARKERRREKKRKKQLRNHAGDSDLDPDMAEAVEMSPPAAALAGPSSAALAEEADERSREEQLKRARDPPIVYKDIDGPAEFEALQRALEGAELAAEELAALDELQQYLRGEGSWVLGDEWLAAVGRLLGPPSKEAARARLLRCLAAAALRDDVALLLHQDRRHHALLNYARRIDAHPLPEQRALALFMCNLFENISSSEWLLYISEWEVDGHAVSNIRATTKVVVHALLADDAELRELGSALVYNVATKEVKTVVFDEVCVELAMAVLQLLQQAPSEEHLFRALAALARLAAHSHDVPQLVAIVGPDPAAYRGTSPRVDEQIDAIMKKVK